MRSRIRFLVAAILFGATLAILAAGVVLAQGPDLGGKLLGGSDITVPSGTVDHDVYAFGGRVTSEATINGELVTAAGTITVDGPVEGDVIATGGQISINGTVGGHVRAAGGTVTINGAVTKDVLAAAGQVTIGTGGKVGGDLIVEGGQLSMDGSVAGSAVGSVGAYSKTGTIAGSDSITITRSQQAPIAPPNPVLDAIRQFVAVVLIGLLVIWLRPRLMGTAEESVRDRPLPSFAWGILVAIGYIVAVVLIAIVGSILALVLAALGFGGLVGVDVFGALLAIFGLTFGFLVVVAFVADAIAGLALARAVLGRRSLGAPRPAVSDARAGLDRWPDLVPFIVGVAVIVALTSLPVVGGWIKLVVALLGLGALWLVWRGTRPFEPAPVPTWSTPGPPTAGTPPPPAVGTPPPPVAPPPPEAPASDSGMS